MVQIGDGLSLEYNRNLGSLNALSRLVAVGGFFAVHDNDALPADELDALKKRRGR